MANISLADQLDDAIAMMIAEPGSAPPKVDLKIGELLGQSAVATTLTRVEWKPARDAEEVILPTLFGVGSGHYPVGRGNFLISTALHLAVLLAVAASGLRLVREPQLRTQVSTALLTDAISMPRIADQGDSGGGMRQKLPESKGSRPRFSREQLTPPTIVVPKEQPRLAEDMTLIGPPELSKPQTSQVGNPLSEILGPLSNGSGSGGGIGTGHGGGIGGGEGA